ncbi:hypothetical protein C3B44_02740 [Corynebacterium yudongzhengii]|uniref:HNH endonuclease n=1 Tax=Corynebacterium yudongzhengii TaxID=2080740 RepID=A0A2U1T527_9CORY|nr:HNH endonuclease signature motif containing protein [Corynebacterium yudongzhengii]AWB81403.1 hypothetical protein C3B44_02740 [Corynebacterium yudongzhengii]PWC01099.1 HNH endonuclease [Corynebacterium yudongzhengii]
MLAIHELTHLDDDSLVQTLHHSNKQTTIFKATLIITLATFHERGLVRTHGAPSTVVWMVRHLQIGESTAYEYLRIGSVLREYPTIASEFLEGSISYSMVRLITKHLTPDNVPRIHEIATSMTLSEARLALAGMREPEETKRLESLRIDIDDDTGWAKITAHMSAENATRFLAALKIAELSNYRDLRKLDPAILQDPKALDRELEEASAEPVEVPAELESSPMVDDNGQPLDPRDATGYGVPMRNNLFSSFLAMINMTRSKPMNRLRTPGAHVNVIVNEEGRPTLPAIPQAHSPELVAAILNGDVRVHLLDKHGVHIMISKAQRLVSDAQAGALIALWNYQCAMPGCNHSRFIHFHHIKAYAEGGKTAVWNLIPICAACHSLVSLGIVSVTIDHKSPNSILFEFPGGLRFASENRSLPMRIEDASFLPLELPEDADSFDDDALPALP